MWAAILAAIKAAGGISGLLNSALLWFREMSRDDMAAKAERLRLIESEMEARDAAANVKPVDSADVVARLRGTGEI